MTNVSEHRGAPINQIFHYRRVWGAKDRLIVRTNLDTLYSMGFLDLIKEPMILTKPETSTFCSVVIFVLYTNCITLCSGRLEDRKSAVYAICGPDYDGDIPEGTVKIAVPQNMVWIGIRTEVGDISEPGSLEKLHAIQDAFSLVPMSEYGNPDYVPPKGSHNPEYDVEPLYQIQNMDIETFFNTFNRLAVSNPGTDADKPTLEKFAKIGVGAGLEFSLNSFAPDIQGALKLIPPVYLGQILEITKLTEHKFFSAINNWKSFADHVGIFGTDYAFRAFIAVAGLGINSAALAVYPAVNRDSNSELFNGSNDYVIRFEKGQLPPCGAFWSITAYDDDGFLIENPINKYAIKSTGGLVENPDGSVELFFQHDSPGEKLTANWLPVHEDIFDLVMRIYLPDAAVLDKTWKPPYVVKK
jgi:hypothetical protein